jgi:hypothetical protein
LKRFSDTGTKAPPRSLPLSTAEVPGFAQHHRSPAREANRDPWLPSVGRVSRSRKRSFPYGNDLGDGEIKLPDPITDVTFCLGAVPATAVQAADVTTTHSATTTAVQHLYCSPPTKP